ncbi:16287_t:CDS:2 [Racocetra persica]|uniref:16287_t:CDS:1 n=1 Tax=Racocetra persica TaxID=160502 RepID=A0ACA9KBP5_9GLOM|nr:16287_t:CDS:2 [Racocetra persica]
MTAKGRQNSQTLHKKELATSFHINRSSCLGSLKRWKGRLRICRIIVPCDIIFNTPIVLALFRKTALIIQLIYELTHNAIVIFSQWKESHEPTIEDVYHKRHNEMCTFDIVDTFGSGYHSHPVQGDIFLLVYDVSSLPSFHRVQDLREQIREIKGSSSPVLLVGNKCDEVEGRVVPCDKRALEQTI